MDVQSILAIIGGIAILVTGLGGLYAYFKRGSDETTVTLQGREIATLTSYNLQLEKKVERLTAENEGLKRENETLKSNPLIIERVVKEVRRLTSAVNKQSSAIIKMVDNRSGRS